MNQLQHLLHDALLGTEHVSNAALLRRADLHVVASTVGFDLRPKDVPSVMDAFKTPSRLRMDGFHFDGRHLRCVRADKNSIYAKDGKTGIVLVRTHTLVILASYTDGMFPSVCVEAVERLGEYFKEKGK